MMRRFLIAALVIVSPLQAPSASALTMKQFADICQGAYEACSNNQALQAYVGGALDLLATLDERTDYLGKVYCKAPKELFDVPSIIRFMLERREEYATDNAMLVFVRYIEERGGCNPK